MTHLTPYRLPTERPDVLFRNATVVTGEEGAEPFVADVLVADGVIAAVGEGLKGKEGATVVDATGHILCPGFIDMHAHSDLYLLTHPDHEAKITQGCTVSREWGGGAGSGVSRGAD
jgi:N-acyl-D-aspartate/D-glutamate deacylase